MRQRRPITFTRALRFIAQFPFTAMGIICFVIADWIDDNQYNKFEMPWRTRGSGKSHD